MGDRPVLLQTSSAAKLWRESLLELVRSDRPWLGDRRARGVEKKEETVGFFRSKVAEWIH